MDLRFTLTYQPVIDFPVALDLLAARKVDPARLVTDQIPLHAVVEQGLRELLKQNERHIKILVDPSQN